MPDERKKEFQTSSGIILPNECSPDNTPLPDYRKDLASPGRYPFTRGIRPSMYRERLWTMRQYAGFSTAEESNRRYRYLLSQGTTGLSVAFDLPTQIGLDSDDPLSAGEVGKVGVAIDSLEDMERLFDKIPLDSVSTSMTINATATTLLALYIAVAKKQGVAIDQLKGTIQNDILKEYIARGTYIYPPAPSLRLVTDTFAYCSSHLPHWNTISISGYHIREAGSTAVQELAFTFSNAITYVKAALEAGLKIDEFAPRLSFFFNSHNNLLEEIAKFRAARRIWARIARERFKAEDARSWVLRFHVQTAGSTLTAQQPEVNVIRTTIQALAAVLGGTQSLHTNSMDEALSLPTEHAARIALRTQQVIAHESGVTDTVDPLGGSYAIEYLTDEIVQREIQEAAYAHQRAVDTHQTVVVGVNEFKADDELPIETTSIDPRIELSQIERLKKLRDRRDSVRFTESISQLEQAARGDENLFPSILNCVESYATVGEISTTLKRVWGEYQEPVNL
jgi:methylmalonyl-CoA mutase, N-terminal domain